MANFFVIGLNHKTAPVGLREEFLTLMGGADEFYGRTLPQLKWEEGVLLSTCNRVEIYGIDDDKKESLENYIKQNRKFDNYLYGFSGAKCVEHLFKVAASLDSMVVGEPQILGQVKEAYLKAKEHEAADGLLSRLFEKTLMIAKKVRSETQVSHRSVSIGSVAIDLAKKVFDDLQGRKLLILGAGEMASQVYKSACDAGVKNIDLANRSQQRAKQVIGDGDGLIHELDAIDERLEEIDVLISSVGCQEFILTEAQVKKAAKVRKGRPLFLIDLGIPRNLEPAINTIANVYLYNVDDLHQVISVNANIRQDEALKAHEIVEKEASGFYSFMLHKNPTIRMLGHKLEQIRQKELEKTLGKLSHLSESDKKIISALSQSLTSKILHDPVIHLKSSEGVESELPTHDLIRRLFRLDET